MHLTAFTDYTLRTLLYLALRPERLATISEVAAAYHISSNHLMKVVQQLAHSGDVVTVRGQHGGLRLGRPPHEINIGDVVRRSEPDMQIVACLAGKDACAIQPVCQLVDVLQEGLQAFLAVLDRYTLEDLVARRQALASLLGLRDGSAATAAAASGTSVAP